VLEQPRCMLGSVVLYATNSLYRWRFITVCAISFSSARATTQCHMLITALSMHRATHPTYVLDL
jgi:hypothetical protein